MNTQFIKYFASFGALLLPALCLAHTEPTAGPVITLLDKDNRSCSLPVPAEGSGETRQYELSAMNSPCKNMNNAVRAIKISNMPSAAQILLTDDPTCSQASGDITDIEDPSRLFWFQLKTNQKFSDPEEMQMTFFTMQASGRIIKKGLVLVSKYQKNDTNEVIDKLSCVKVIASAARLPAPSEPVTTTAGQWTEVNEPGSVFQCPANQVLLGREHKGDESAPTLYQCGTLKQAGKTVTVQNNQRSDAQKESSSYFTCGLNAVMTGREHLGDEHGDTRHWCGGLKGAAGDTLNVTADEWSATVKESDHRFICPPNKVLLGRTHKGDENGTTRYRCGAPYSQPAQLP